MRRSMLSGGIFRIVREVTGQKPRDSLGFHDLRHPDLHIPHRRIVSTDGFQTQIELFRKDVLHLIIPVEDLTVKVKLKSTSKGVTFRT